MEIQHQIIYDTNFDNNNKENACPKKTKPKQNKTKKQQKRFYENGGSAFQTIHHLTLTALSI
jgi:hypothetical protein